MTGSCVVTVETSGQMTQETRRNQAQNLELDHHQYMKKDSEKLALITASSVSPVDDFYMEYQIQ
jgi:hypothetical protein